MSDLAKITEPDLRCCGTCRAVYRGDFERCPTDGTELSACEADPIVGTTINGLYYVDECVGEGAMGRVYRAHHLRLLRRQVALKILIGDLAASVAMRMRFTQEAQAASLLSHPNVVAVLDFGKTVQGLLYMAMEYVEGRSLSRIIAEEAPLDPARVVRMTRELCLGLSHAHSQGLIHRDFKPDNVLVVQGREGEVPRIADFGLAIFSDGDRNSARLTSAGTVVGTPLYTAPEQLLDRGIDQRADLFGLGVTMYEMLAGCAPFDDKSPIQMLHNNLAAPRPRIAERAPGVEVPVPLELIVHRLMSSDREQRYPSAQAVIQALSALEGLEPTVMPEIDGNRTTQSLIISPVQRRRIAIGAALATGLGLAILALLWPARSQPSAPPAAVTRAPPAAVAREPAAAAGRAPSGGPPHHRDPPVQAAQPAAVTEPAGSAGAEPDTARGPAVRKPARAIGSTVGRSSPAARPRIARREPGGGSHGILVTIDPVEDGPAPLPASSSVPLQTESPTAGAAPARPAPARDERSGQATATVVAGGLAGSAGEVTGQPAPGNPAGQAAQPGRPPPGDEPPRAPAGKAGQRVRTGARVRAVIEELAVEGSLSDAEVRRGVARVQPRLDSCYRAAAGRAGRNSAGAVRVRFVVDETGRARRIQVDAGELPDLSACVSEAIAAVRTRVPPDIGDVRVSLRVRLAQDEER